jgi:hypothetical protein
VRKHNKHRAAKQMKAAAKRKSREQKRKKLRVERLAMKDNQRVVFKKRLEKEAIKQLLIEFEERNKDAQTN